MTTDATVPRVETQAPADAVGDAAATLERLDFSVQGPTADTMPMNVTLCTSTTTSCSSRGKKPH